MIYMVVRRHVKICALNVLFKSRTFMPIVESKYADGRCLT
jgi:hypothetical protein